MQVPHTKVVTLERASAKVLKGQALEAMQAEVSHCMVQCVGSGISAPVLMGMTASAGIFASPAPTQVRWASNTKHLHMSRVPDTHQGTAFSICSASPPTSDKEVSWTAYNYIEAHKLVRNSGKFNYESCRIPIPTKVRFDEIRLALGSSVMPKEERVLSLLEFGMPVFCKASFGIRKPQKNHFSAVSFKKEVSEYFSKGVQSKALLGPFNCSPIPDLCFSPLMSVPKDDSKRRVIVDFSFPPGKSINDGIPKDSYLDFEVKFSLPSVKSMIDRINNLGVGCHLFKRDLKGAFRQFNIDPGDYRYTGLCWDGKIFLDTRLAMGLRSAAFCCQSVTELVAKIVGGKAFVMVYLDDFGGAESTDRAQESFDYLGNMLARFGLEEAPEKAVPPTTRMDWLGINFDTLEWTIALKPGKLQELLDWLPKLLR